MDFYASPLPGGSAVTVAPRVLHQVLLIEDEYDIAQLLKLHLHDLHVGVTWCKNGRAGLEKIFTNPWSLIVLDLSLPDVDGLHVCERFRQQNEHTPVLMLTARCSERERVLGLDTGADDYLTKPFGILEFTARVRALLRRARLQEHASHAASVLKVGELEVDQNKREVRCSGCIIELTAREYDLLLFLIRHAGRPFSRARLLKEVWNVNTEAYEHTVSSHINRLRAKLEPDPTHPRYLLTVWGIGYRFADR